ncbi:hypothetical protein [Streptosporangium sp. NPDC000509]
MFEGGAAEEVGVAEAALDPIRVRPPEALVERHPATGRAAVTGASRQS